ncbi:MAG: hypothetical protein U0Z44_03545 [Kouleothrix sp.]
MRSTSPGRAGATAQSRGAAIEIIKQLQPVSPLAGRPSELRGCGDLIINVDAITQGSKPAISDLRRQACRW